MNTPTSWSVPGLVPDVPTLRMMIEALRLLVDAVTATLGANRVASATVARLAF